MKFAFIILLLAFCTTKKHSNCVRRISIENVGVITDKPIFPLVITTQKDYLPAKHTIAAIIIMTDEEFTDTEKNIASFESSELIIVSDSTPGAFRVSTNDSCKRAKHFVYNIEKTKKLFLDLKKASHLRPTVRKELSGYVDDNINRF